MNRLGSGSNWLTRCCCFEKSLVECSAQWKKKINLGLSLVQGSQITAVLSSCSSHLSWHSVMSSVQGPGFQGPGPSQAFPALTPLSPLLYPGVDVWDLHRGCAMAGWATWPVGSKPPTVKSRSLTSSRPLLMATCLWGLP